ncbi:MAG: diaminopimelate decarboxylase [Puniceicoccales bacterium]|jgi:diaminopimelate decarboxylase|nr:diaminopimelate decarboxylase [Puniceicoccales bacterium]
MNPTQILSPELARSVALRHGTPVYVYSQAALERQARAALAFPHAGGLTVRFAMKALPTAAVLRLFDGAGLHFDASSGHEVWRALRAGIAPAKVSLSTQELPAEVAELLAAGVRVNACSLAQLETLGRLCPGSPVGVRLNPGRGSGGTGKTNVGGPDASFGIWHEYTDAVREGARRHRLEIVRVHTHIGSGSDPGVWQEVARASLSLVREFPGVRTLNLGGGFKVARVAEETGTDLRAVGAPVRAAFERFAEETGRALHLEIEPGTYLVANCGVLLARVQDITDTGLGGRCFLKLDTGMTELLRPTLYGAQHPLEIVPADAGAGGDVPGCDYVVVGHCCESGDLVTCAPGMPEVLSARRLRQAQPGDLCLIGGAGAYCAAMSAKNYNSFPEAPEVLVGVDGVPRLIRRRQTLEQMVQNELEAG